jgi:hypothetical protein
MLFILSFITKQFIIIHKGIVSQKILASFTLSVAFSPFVYIYEKTTHWYIENQTYIYWVCVAIFFDYLFGVVKHLKLKTFSWKQNGLGLLIKVGMAVGAGILYEAIPYFLGEKNIVSDSLLIVMRLSVFMYPAGSCWMNMYVVTNETFPPIGWIDRIKNFNKNLNINELKNGKPSEEN